MPTVADISQLLSIPAPTGAAAVTITGVAVLADATPTELSFLGSDRYLKQFAVTRAAAVIVQRRVKVPPGNRVPTLLVDDADLAVARVLELFAPPIPRPPVGVDPAARVAASAV